MIIEFRVLAISKERGSYDTDLIRGVFGSEHPMLDTVDHLPANAAITVLQQTNWTPTVKAAIDKGDYIFVPFVGATIE